MKKIMHPLYWANIQGDKAAFIMSSSGEATSYAELAQQFCQGAHLLKSLHQSSGDGLVLLSENNVDFLGVFWAAQVSGMYFTPISTQLQTAEIEYVLNNCDASVLVVSSAQAKKIADIKVPQKYVFTLQEWRTACSTMPADFHHLPKTCCEGAEMLYSSGSTGKPKGVRNAQPGASLGSISKVLKTRLKLHKIDHNSVYLSPAPPVSLSTSTL